MNEIAALPKLSVVVAIVSDTTSEHVDTSYLRGCLLALQNQIDPPAMEIIVPYHQQVGNVEQLQAEFPQVTFHNVDNLIPPITRNGRHERHQKMRALGLLQAQGEIVGMLEDVGRPSPNWCAQAVIAHRADFAAVGGAMENGVDRQLNWAVYFCDFGRYQNPVPAGPTRIASDANVTYKRHALESVRDVWREAFYEPEVNAALLGRNERLALSPYLVVYQHRTGLKFGNALQERTVWARAYAANRSKNLGIARRLMLAVLSPLLPILLLLRMTLNVARKRRSVGPYLKALPVTICMVIAVAWGELLGYATGQANGGAA